VADLEYKVPALCQFNQRFGFLKRCRNRFLNQHINIILQQDAGNVEMRTRWRRDAHCVDFPNQRFEIGKGLYIEFCCQFSAAIGVLIDHRQEIRILERGKLFCVPFSLMADANDCCPEFIQ
jgi:hypothetical protein